MDTNTAILVSMLLPLIAAVSNLFHCEQHNLRDGITMIAALGTFGSVLSILMSVGNATTETWTLLSVMPGLDIAFSIEPLGLLFALIASGLWCVTHLYAIGYMRGNNEDNHPRFFAAFLVGALSIIGLPPFGGSWSKWLLMVGAADASQCHDPDRD